MCILLADYNTRALRVAAMRDMVTGGYKWDTGTSISSEEFYPGEPKQNDDCIQMLSEEENFKYDDVDCEKPKRYVCEKSLLL